MITVGQKFPKFSKTAVISSEPGNEFETISSDSLTNNDGRWTIMFWWTNDFSAVCPSELIEFNNMMDEFKARKTHIIGASCNATDVHIAWRIHDPNIGKVQFPMISDFSKSLAEELGILLPGAKVPLRATYIIDPEGVIKWVSVNHPMIARNVNEVMRNLDALQTGKLTPCNWEKGQATI